MGETETETETLHRLGILTKPRRRARHLLGSFGEEIGARVCAPPERRGTRVDDGCTARSPTRRKLHAQVFLKRRAKKTTETIPDTVPSIEQATLWLAELSGYTRKSSGSPPSSNTISGGLFKLRAAADAIGTVLAKDDENG